MPEQIIKNIKTLISLVETQPENLLDLSMFCNETACGTMFCVAGLAASTPFFQGQGLDLTRGDIPVLTIDGQRFTSAMREFDQLFGPSTYERLFERRYGSVFDIPFIKQCTNEPSDKEVALNRLRLQLALVEQS